MHFRLSHTRAFLIVLQNSLAAGWLPSPAMSGTGFEDVDLDAPAARAPAAAEDEGSGLQLRDMLQKWDYFRKVPRDLTESTEQGASISAAGAWFLILLFLLEFRALGSGIGEIGSTRGNKSVLSTKHW